MNDNLIDQFRTNHNCDKIKTVEKPRVRGYNPADSFEKRVEFLSKRGMTLGEIVNQLVSTRFETKDDFSDETLTPTNVCELKVAEIIKSHHKHKRKN